MTIPTLPVILDAVAATLETATGLTRTQSYDELTESIPDTPLLQVYPEEGQPDKLETLTRRMERITVHADLYAHRRANIGEDMQAVVDNAQEILEVIRAQDPTARFGLAGIRHFEWSWRRVLFPYNGVDYAGVRFIFNLWVDA